VDKDLSLPAAALQEFFSELEHLDLPHPEAVGNRLVLEQRDKEPRAALPVEMFYHQLRKQIGALTAALEAGSLGLLQGGSVNAPRRCGGKHKRWRGQRSIAFFCRRPLPPRARATAAVSPAPPFGDAANRLRATQGVLTSDGVNLTGWILSKVRAVSADGLTIHWTA